jgi:hypothetical protein
VAGDKVSVGRGNGLGGRVAVMIKVVGVEESSEDKLKSQPETRRAAVRIKKKGLRTRQL